MPSTTRRLAALAVAAAAVLALTACGGGGASSDTSSSGSSGGSGSGSGTLTLGAVVPPSTFAAANSGWANESPYLQAVYDSLIRETPDGQLEPSLATEWSYNADNTVLTMKLRDDVTFTDGQKFTAEVAAQNVLRFKNGTSASASQLALVTDATATDANTLQVTLSAPDPALLLNLTQSAGLQESPSAFDAADAQTTPVGSGPYQLDTSATVVGSTYVFTKNPNYWAPDDQHYQTVNITVLSDAQAGLNAIQGSQVDVMPLIDPTGADQVKASGYTTAEEKNNSWNGLILFDRAGQVTPALGDVRVRQAIAHAIDRDGMVTAGGGTATVTGQIFNENNPAYDKALDDQYPYDPAKAKQLLAEAGYPDGFTLQMPQFQVGSTVVFDLIKQNLADVGITVDYVETPLSDAISSVLSQKYSATYFILTNNPTVWQDANFVLTPTAPFNAFHTTDPKVEALVSTVQTGTQEESDNAGQELNQYIVDQAWFVPFDAGVGYIAVGPNTNVVVQPDNAYPYLWNITPKS